MWQASTSERHRVLAGRIRTRIKYKGLLVCRPSAHGRGARPNSVSKGDCVGEMKLEIGFGKKEKRRIIVVTRISPRGIRPGACGTPLTQWRESATSPPHLSLPTPTSQSVDLASTVSVERSSARDRQLCLALSVDCGRARCVCACCKAAPISSKPRLLSGSRPPCRKKTCRRFRKPLPMISVAVHCDWMSRSTT